MTAKKCDVTRALAAAVVYDARAQVCVHVRLRVRAAVAASSQELLLSPDVVRQRRQTLKDTFFIINHVFCEAASVAWPGVLTWLGCVAASLQLLLVVS